MKRHLPEPASEQEKQLVRTLALELDGLSIAEELIPKGSFAVRAMAKNLQLRLDRKLTTGVRSCLSHCYG